MGILNPSNQTNTFANQFTLAGVAGPQTWRSSNAGGGLTFTGSRANSYSGGTLVNYGTIVLARTANSVVIGPDGVPVGDSAGAAASAIVRLGDNQQIADYTPSSPSSPTVASTSTASINRSTSPAAPAKTPSAAATSPTRA